jgi:hypothetical protein
MLVDGAKYIKFYGIIVPVIYFAKVLSYFTKWKINNFLFIFIYGIFIFLRYL